MIEPSRRLQDQSGIPDIPGPVAIRMTSATIVNNAPQAPAHAPRLLGLYLLLIIMAAIEAFDGLSHLPALFGDMLEIPGSGIGGAIIKAPIVGHPLLALAALGLASVGRLRNAIMMLGTLVLMSWLNDMPSVVRHGLDLKGLSAFETPMQIIAFPLMGACAIAFAARRQRLGLAAVLVSIPTLYGIFALIAFGIGVMVKGF
jgi:hypothetical protein